MKVSSSSILSLALVLNGALASPLRARDYAVVTVTEVATEVVHITSTTWVDPAQYNYNPTEAPTPTTNPNEKHKNKSHVPTNTPSTTLSTTTPTTISTPSASIPTTTSLPTTSLPTATSIPTTTSELPTSLPSLLPTSTSIPVPTSTPVPPTTLETSTLPVPTTSVSIPTVKVVPSTTAPAPVPTTGGGNTPSTGSGDGTVHTGQGTFYSTGLGACGVTSQDSDHIVAISQALFDSQGTADPNKNPFCGKTVMVQYKGGPKIACKIVDRCTGCVGDDLDLSPSAFTAMGANEADGRVPISWTYAS